MGGSQYINTIQLMSDEEYAEYEKLKPQERLRYVMARTRGVSREESMKQALDYVGERARHTVQKVNGTMGEYNRLQRNIKTNHNKEDAEFSLGFVKKELRVLRSELIKLLSELPSGALRANVELSLMQVRNALK